VSFFRLSICITCPDGSSQVVPFSVKELVVLDTLLDHGAQLSSEDDQTGLQECIMSPNKQVPHSQSDEPTLLKPLPLSGDEELMHQKKKLNTKKISSRMIASGTFLLHDLNIQALNLKFPESNFVFTGWVDLEFEEAWSQPGFVHMTVIASIDAGSLEPPEVRVLKTLQGLVKSSALARPVMAIGSSRRYLIQPVVKA
jgi:hypothetical protein